MPLYIYLLINSCIAIMSCPNFQELLWPCLTFLCWCSCLCFLGSDTYDLLKYARLVEFLVIARTHTILLFPPLSPVCVHAWTDCIYIDWNIHVMFMWLVIFCYGLLLYLLQSWRHQRGHNLMLVSLMLKWMSCKNFSRSSILFPVTCFVIDLWESLCVHWILSKGIAIWMLIPCALFDKLMVTGFQLMLRTSSHHMMRFMIVLMLWDCKRIFWGGFMLMVDLIIISFFFLFFL